MEEPNGGPDGGAKWGAGRRSQIGGQTRPDGGPNGARWSQTWLDGGLDRARRRARQDQTGWRTEGLFTFKRKNDMFCIRVM
jgi:hypothetical protein